METEHIRILKDTITNLRVGMKKDIQKQLREGNFDITYEMLQVLSLLWRKSDLNQQDIANELQKNKASITPLIDNLSKRKLVVRTEDSSDRRNKIISLTKLGKDYKEEFLPLTNELFNRMGEGIPKDELTIAISVLKQMSKNLNI